MTIDYMMPYKLKPRLWLDVSHWEGFPDWDYVFDMNPEIEGVIGKLSEYGNYKYLDKTALHLAQSLGRLNKPYGFYHFYRWERDASSQAYWFLECLEKAGGLGAVTPILDVEWRDYRYGKNWIKAPRGTAYGNQLKIWLDIVEKATGKVPMVYTSDSYIDEYLRDRLWRIALPDYKKYPLWIAQYPYQPDKFDVPYNVPKDWQWVLWQYDDAGEFKGFPYDGVDVNTRNEFYDMTQGYVRPPLEENPYHLPRDVRVSADPYLNIRKDASVNYPKVGILRLNSIVMVLEVKDVNGSLWGRIGDDKWIAINYNGKQYCQWI